MLPISEAAKQVGKSVSAVNKAIKSGRLSAEKDGNGQWVIQPAELFRLWKPLEQVSNGNSIEIKGLQREIELQREQINLLREQLSQSGQEKEQILKMMEEQISSLKALTDQRQEKPEEGRGFWRRLFG